MPKKSKSSSSSIKEIFGKEIEQMTEEELRQAVLRVQLLREVQLLDQTREEVYKRDENIAACELRNEQRQTELAAIAEKMCSIQKQCRHKQGGKHQNIFKGDGPPCVTAARMLDSFTLRLECTRCRKTVYTPNPSLEQTDPKLYRREMAEYEKFLEMFEDSGLDMIRGPEFMFRKNGISFIPERV